MRLLIVLGLTFALPAMAQQAMPLQAWHGRLWEAREAVPTDAALAAAQLRALAEVDVVVDSEVLSVVDSRLERLATALELGHPNAASVAIATLDALESDARGLLESRPEPLPGQFLPSAAAAEKLRQPIASQTGLVAPLAPDWVRRWRGMRRGVAVMWAGSGGHLASLLRWALPTAAVVFLGVGLLALRARRRIEEPFRDEDGDRKPLTPLGRTLHELLRWVAARGWVAAPRYRTSGEILAAVPDEVRDVVASAVSRHEAVCYGGREATPEDHAHIRTTTALLERR